MAGDNDNLSDVLRLIAAAHPDECPYAKTRTLGRSLVALSIPESTRPQLYFLIATHAISLALVLASLLLRVRKPSFWLFRRHASSPLILPNFSILVAGAMIAIIPLFQVLFARILQSFERAVPPADLGYEVLFVGSAAWWICEIVTWSISASYLVNLSSQGREIYVYANLCNIVGIASPFVFLVGTVTYTVLGGHAYDRAVTIFAELDRILSQYEVQWMPGDDPATIPVPSVELSDAFAIQLERAASLFRQNFLFQAISACILWVILVGVAVPYLRSFRKTIVSQGRALQASGTVNAQCVKKRKQLHKTWLSLLLILTVFAVYCLVVCVLSFAIYLTPQNSKGSRKLAQAILFGPFTTTGVLGIPLGWVLLWKAYRVEADRRSDRERALKFEESREQPSLSSGERHWKTSLGRNAECSRGSGITVTTVILARSESDSDFKL